MKKIVSQLIVIGALAAAMPAFANHQTLTAGFARSNMDDVNHISGVNLKYYWEQEDSPFGVVGSFTYMQGKENSTFKAANDILSGDAKAQYYALSVGPAYRLNDYISAYGLIGAGVTQGKGDYHWLNYTSSGYEDLGNLSTKENRGSVVYGVGLQVNPIDNLAVDLSYEGTQVKINGKNYNINAFVVGVGYRF
ncbi:Ail/Lom family outer membrane beta-barrel protein [Utexia brackfieldae]|uniref:Ail/Lom family outer membrane beta-barrel protein n=1 Tax=Utexia brackfieldae TaxID=3074108 RepID=UPI00370D7166